MKLVIIESPYAGDVDRNARYLQACLFDCLRRGEAPFASHGLYTKCLHDEVPEQRRMGIAAGHEWMRRADLVACYQDLGISPGMKAGLDLAASLALPIERRNLPRDLFERWHCDWTAPDNDLW